MSDFWEWLNTVSISDCWFYSLTEKERMVIERRLGISWEDLSNVGKEMIYKENKEGSYVYQSSGQGVNEGVSD